MASSNFLEDKDIAGGCPEGATVRWDGQRFVPVQADLSLTLWQHNYKVQQERTQHWFNAAQFAFRRGFWCGACVGAVVVFVVIWTAFNYGAGL